MLKRRFKCNNPTKLNILTTILAEYIYFLHREPQKALGGGGKGEDRY